MPAEEQTELLRFSAKKSSSLQKKHLQMEKDAIRRRRDLLPEAQQHQQATVEHKHQQVMAVMADLMPHHELCSTSTDIN